MCFESTSPHITEALKGNGLEDHLDTLGKSARSHFLLFFLFFFLFLLLSCGFFTFGSFAFFDFFGFDGRLLLLGVKTVGNNIDSALDNDDE